METGRDQDVETIVGSLTQEDKAVLLAATENGDLFKFSSQIADWVGGKQDLTDGKNPVIAVSHLEALQNLVAKRFVTYESGAHYRLSSLGFKVRSALSSRVKS